MRMQTVVSCHSVHCALGVLDLCVCMCDNGMNRIFTQTRIEVRRVHDNYTGCVYAMLWFLYMLTITYRIYFSAKIFAMLICTTGALHGNDNHHHHNDRTAIVW